MFSIRSLSLAACAVLLAACSQEIVRRETSTGAANLAEVSDEPTQRTDEPMTADEEVRSELATFGAGCFWCVEAVLEQLDGVLDVTSGYMGGHTPDPTYKEVCGGDTGHAEVVQVTFDPARISYRDLLAMFWKLHDPTTPNRQGADVGTQYRSAIFYHSDEQRSAAEESRAEHAGDFADPIVTEITQASRYYEGEQYHQNYYRLNKNQGYCRAVIVPKLEKLGLEK